MKLSVEKSRSLGQHSSQQLGSSSCSTPKKLTIVTKINSAKKKSSPVSFKNSFKNILLCQYNRGHNQEQIQALLEKKPINRKKQTQRTDLSTMQLSLDLTERKPSQSFNKNQTLWNNNSPINKLNQFK